MPKKKAPALAAPDSSGPPAPAAGSLAADTAAQERAESRRVSLALMPTVMRSYTDLPHANVKNVKGLVHQAAMLCLSDQEFASYVQIGLEGYYKSGGRWCVLAGRGLLAYKSRFKPGTRALFNVPCLAVDLAQDGAVPPGLTITCLMFQPADDSALTYVTQGPRLAHPSAEAQQQQPTPAAVVDAAGASAAAGAEAAAPLPNPPLPPAPRARLVPLLETDAVSPSACACSEGAAHLGLIVGGVLEEVGLNPATDTEFCVALKNALTLEYGEGTWHVFLGQALGSGAPTQQQKQQQQQLVTKAPSQLEGAGGGAGAAAAPPLPPPPPQRSFSPKELLGFAAVDPKAHVAALAPPRFTPGSFMEVELSPRRAAAATAAPGSAAGPRRYQLMFFMTGEGEVGRRAATQVLGLLPTFLESTNLGLWLAEPLIAARVVLNAIGFACFLGYAWLTHGHSNACGRLSAPSVGGGAAAGGGGGAPPTLFPQASPPLEHQGGGALSGSVHGALEAYLFTPCAYLFGHALRALDLFSSDPATAASALGLPALPFAVPLATGSGGDLFVLPEGGSGGGGGGGGAAAAAAAAAAACTNGAILEADLRLARGRFLIFVTLVCIIVSIVVLKPTQKIGNSMRLREVLSGISRQGAQEAARSIRAPAPEKK